MISPERRLLGWRAIASVCVIGACSDGPVAPSNGAPATLFPLAIGTQWTYDLVDSIEFTTDTLVRSYHRVKTVRVIGDTIDPAGRKWAVLDSANYLLDGPITGPTYVANLVGGGYSTLFLSPFASAFEYPYPTVIGATANFGITRVLSTDRIVTVPAGTFHCIVYAELSDTLVVAPGVGVVWRSLSPVTAFDGKTGQLQLKDQTFYFLKSVSIPPGAADPDANPPSPHD